MADDAAAREPPGDDTNPNEEDLEKERQRLLDEAAEAENLKAEQAKLEKEARNSRRQNRKAKKRTVKKLKRGIRVERISTPARPLTSAPAAKFASVEPVDVVWGETGPMEFDIHSFDKLEDLGFGKRVPLGQLTGPDLLCRSASSATSLESTLLIYDRGNLARSIGADFFVRDSIKPAITLTNSESAMAHGVKRAKGPVGVSKNIWGY